MRQIFQTEIEKVLTSFPSIYSKDDVVKLLTDLNSKVQFEIDEIENNHNFQFSDESLQIIVDETIDSISNEFNYSEFIVNDSATFSIYHREIEIESIDFDTESYESELSRFLKRTLAGNIQQAIEHFNEHN